MMALLFKSINFGTNLNVSELVRPATLLVIVPKIFWGSKAGSVLAIISNKSEHLKQLKCILFNYEIVQQSMNSTMYKINALLKPDNSRKLYFLQFCKSTFKI